MSSLAGLADRSVEVIVVALVTYYLALNSSYLVFVWHAALDATRRAGRPRHIDHGELLRDPLTPPISIVVPARDEEAVIMESVRSLLSLRYPELEVIVVDDGSTDRTFELLRDEFSLIEVPICLDERVPVVGEVRSFHTATDGSGLRVLRKESAGTKPDANNAGVAAARYPLVAVVDADTVLDPDALLEAARPFVDRPDRTIAVGGVVRPANGSVLRAGQVEQVRMPRSLLARLQVIEYVRSFQLARISWSRLRGVLIISGAFGVFRRDLVVETGGFDIETVGEDFELIVRFHRHMRDAPGPRDYEIAFLATPVCWTEVPEGWRALSAQRRRWARGLAETLARHRSMIFRPRYGRVGSFAMPYYLLFELLGPPIELLGLVVIAIGLATGAIDLATVGIVLLVSIGYGVLVSLLAAGVDSSASGRIRRPVDAVRLVAASIVEHLGFRHAIGWWQLRGILSATRKRRRVWHSPSRQGFEVETPA